MKCTCVNIVRYTHHEIRIEGHWFWRHCISFNEIRDTNESYRRFNYRLIRHYYIQSFADGNFDIDRVLGLAATRNSEDNQSVVKQFGNDIERESTRRDKATSWLNANAKKGPKNKGR